MYELPKLHYDYNALEPNIDEQTMKLHHMKHHQTYVDKLNAAVKGTKFEKMPVDDILRQINNVPENIRQAVKNHGGGHSNHTFFWNIMAPKAGGNPVGKLSDAISNTFGSFDKFKEEFTNAATNRFGSGWAWLVADKERLSIISTANQDSPLMEGKVPILGIDVWEHAYYKKFGPARAEYISAWWNVVNWPQAETNYKNTMK